MRNGLIACWNVLDLNQRGFIEHLRHHSSSPVHQLKTHLTCTPGHIVPVRLNYLLVLLDWREDQTAQEECD